MKNLILALVVSFASLTAVADTVVNPTAVSSIIEASELVKCVEQYCYNVDTLKEVATDTEFPDGIHVIFPVGLVSDQELESSKFEVMLFWNKHYNNLMANRGLFLE